MPLKRKKTTKLEAAGSVDKHGGETKGQLARIDRGDGGLESTREGILAAEHNVRLARERASPMPTFTAPTTTRA